MSYFLVSMKHTHRGDKFISFWKPNDCGYTIFREDFGEYETLKEGYHNSEHTLPVEAGKIKPLLEMWLEGPEWKMVVLNTPSNWSRLGLKLTKNGLRRITTK